MLPKIQLGESQHKNTLVIPFLQEDKEKDASFYFPGKKNKDIDQLESKLKEAKHFHGKKNEVNFLRFYSFQGYENVLCLGLGKESKINPEIIRQAGAAIYQAQAKEHIKQVHVLGDGLLSKIKSSDQVYTVQAFSEGYFLASYHYPKSEPKKDSFKVEGLSLSNAKDSEAVKKAEVIIEQVNFARSLGDKPANLMTPTILAKQIQERAKKVGLKCKVLGKSEITKEKMGLFLTVAQGSVEDPKFIILEHNGGKKSENPICLIGKGVTFDSGGISLKPSSKMEEMKYDMMGSATVAAVCLAAAELNIPKNIYGFIAATENMPSGNAQKPGDVQTSITGKTVEVNNTDAEGRLILADAIEYVQKYYKPECMIDYATLTGAVLYAIGTVATGIMGIDNNLIQRLKKSSEKTGEKVWELPLYEEYEEDLKSHFADIKNSGVSEAGSSKGGTFLKFFVDKKIPWVHCDIAGTAWHRKDVNYYSPKYASGHIIRLTLDMLENW